MALLSAQSGGRNQISNAPLIAPTNCKDGGVGVDYANVKRLVTAIHLPKDKPRPSKKLIGGIIGAHNDSHLWEFDDFDTGHAAIIPWEVRPLRPGETDAPNSKSRFVRTNYVAIDLDDEISREEVIQRIKDTLGGIGYRLSRSSSGKKWHIVIPLKYTINDYETYAAVRGHLAEIMEGGDTAYQAYLYICPTNRRYEEFAGSPFDASGIQPRPNTSKTRERSTRKANKAVLPDRVALIDEIMGKCIAEEGLADKLIHQTAADGCVSFSVPECEQSPWSFWYYPDADEGMTIHHFNKARWDKALYGRNFDSRVANYVRSKGICPIKFNKVISKCAKLLRPVNAIECIMFLHGRTPSLKQILSVIVVLFSVRNRCIKDNLTRVCKFFQIPQRILTKLIPHARTACDKVFTAIKELYAGYTVVADAIFTTTTPYRLTDDSQCSVEDERRKSVRNATQRGKRKGKRMGILDKMRGVGGINEVIERIISPAMKELGATA